MKKNDGLIMNLAWIPNSITMGNLLFGFLSLVFASKGSFTLAGISILFASLLDGCDGQAARMLKVQSKIGAELDSLADCVTFGIAPGFLALNAYFSEINFIIHGKIIPLGIFVAAIFPICAAYRLARFNVEHDDQSFAGLPSPIAGIIIALLPIAMHDPSFIKSHLPFFIPLYIITALLMVSTVKFSKPQAVLYKKLHGIKFVAFIILIIVLLFIFKKWILFIIIGMLCLYILAGILMFVIQFIQDYKY